VPTDWKTFWPQKMIVKSKHITLTKDRIYVSAALMSDMGGPGLVRIQINEKAKAIAITLTDDSDPAVLRLTRQGIRNKALTAALFAVFPSAPVRMKAKRHTNGKSWIFHYFPNGEDTGAESGESGL